MKTLFHTSIFLFIAITQCMIFGRPRVNYTYSGYRRGQDHMLHHPQSHVFTRFSKSSPSRYQYSRGLRFASNNRNRYQRRAELMDHGHDHEIGGQLLHGNHYVEFKSQGNYQHNESVEVHSHPYDNGNSYIDHGPNHAKHDKSVENVEKQLIGLINHSPPNQPVSVDPKTLKIIIGFLKELKHAEGQSGVLKPNEEYELKIKKLTERIHHLEMEVNTLEKEKEELLAGGHVSEAQAKEHEIHDVQNREDDLQLDLDKAEDVHIREGIQALDEEEQRLEAEGGHDDQLGDLETDKAELEVKDAFVDEDIKKLEIDKLSKKIATLQDEKAQSNDPVLLQQIQEKIDNLKKERATISSDKQITGELKADMVEDENKINKLNAQVGHTGQVVSLLRAKRMLKKAVRRLEDEDAEIDKEENVDESGDNEENKNESEDNEEKKNEDQSIDEEELVSYMAACKNLIDFQDSFNYVTDELYKIYEEYEREGEGLTVEFQEKFNARLEKYAEHADIAINCIVKYIQRYEEHPDIKDFLDAEEIEVDDSELLDKIKHEFDIVFSDDIRDIVEDKISIFLLKKIETEDDLKKRFREIDENYEQQVVLTEGVNNMLEDLYDANKRLEIGLDDIYGPMCAEGESCEDEDDHKDDDDHENHEDHEDHEDHESHEDHKDHEDHEDHEEDPVRRKMLKRLHIKHHRRRVKHRRQLRRSHYRILKRY